MAIDARATSERKHPKSAKRRRRGNPRAVLEPPTIPDQPEEFFDEPARPPRQSIVPVEKPIPAQQRDEDTEACGLPDETQTRGSDLH